MANKKRGVIGFKLLFMILMCSSVITLLSAFVQIGFTYKNGKKDISNQLEQVKLTHTKSLSKSLWIFDTVQIGIELEGILNYPDINYVEISTETETIASKGKKVEIPAEAVNIDLSYKTKTNLLQLGTLKIQATEANLRTLVKEQAAVILITQGVKTFIVSALILFFINLLLTRHLEKIASYASGVSIDEDHELSLDRKAGTVEDELDVLVSAINNMRSNLQKAYSDLSSESEHRKIAGEELYKQASLLGNIINGIPAYIYWMDLEGKYLGCNDLYADLTNYASNEIVGKTLGAVAKNDESIAYFHQVDKDVVVSNKAKWNQELQVENQKGGSSFYVQSVVPMSDRNGEAFGVLGLFIDITPKIRSEQEKRAMETQVLKSAKMASMGELAAGVGHEINNPLAIIQGNLELLTDHLEDNSKLDSESRNLINIQMVAINRIRGIVDGLRVFARKDTDDREMVDIHQALEETFGLVKSLYENENVKLVLELGAKKQIVLINRNKFQQAIMNLLSNAKDALLDSAKEEEKLIVIQTKEFKGRLTVSVIDNADGMSSECAEQIFDPYFTTKKVGKGTGIGLDITKKIVETYDGLILLDTAIGQGTAISLEFPFADQFAKNSVLKMDKSFTGELLVVDDDENVRELVCRHLRAFGFSVDEANCGQQAIAMASKKSYSGVFTDMKMPGMSGIELLKSLHQLNLVPPLKVLVSGGADEQAEINEQLDKEIHFDLVLSKPFSKRELEKSLRSVLTAA